MTALSSREGWEVLNHDQKADYSVLTQLVAIEFATDQISAEQCALAVLALTVADVRHRDPYIDSLFAPVLVDLSSLLSQLINLPSISKRLEHLRR